MSKIRIGELFEAITVLAVGLLCASGPALLMANGVAALV
jgi:hypothetical protein